MAPPGSGKTTLLARAVDAAGLPAAWYRVTPEDASEDAFVSYLGRAMRESLGVAVPARVSLERLIGAVDAAGGGQPCWSWTTRTSLIGSPAAAALSRLLALRPAG